MKINEILVEAKVAPDEHLTSELSYIVDAANTAYQEYLGANGDVDNIEELAEFLNDEAELEDLPITFHVNHEARRDPNEWISAMASWEDDDNKQIDFVLHAQNLQGKWGPKTFKNMLIRAIRHETIHFGQYDRMGKDKVGSTLSGHQKGTLAKEKGGTERDWMRMYLRDPHEIMAYGHDLADELRDVDGAEPGEALRRIEQFKDQLPTYQRFRSIFPANTPQIRALLKYTSQYL